MRPGEMGRNVGRNGRGKRLARKPHHALRESSASLAVKARVFFESIRRVCLCAARRQLDLPAIVGSEVLTAIGRPEDRLAVGRIGLGELVTEQFALTGVRRRDLWRRRQFEARLVEVLARVHHFGAEPDRFVARLWIR